MNPFDTTPDLQNENQQGESLEVSIFKKHSRSLLLSVNFGKLVQRTYSYELNFSVEDPEAQNG